MDEELLPNEGQQEVMSNEEINAEIGTPSPQPLSETDVATAPQFSTDPVDPLLNVQRGIDGIKPEEMIGSSQMMTRSTSLDDTRRYKGIGAFDNIPKDEHVDVLRKEQKDPDAVAAFDYKYGKGAASRYLALASKDHIKTLIANRKDEDAVDAFNSIYGPGMANLYATLYDPKANVNQKYQASVQIINILNGAEVAPKKSVIGTIGDSIFTGAANTIQEVARSVGALDKNSPSYRQDGVGISDYPITESIVTNLTQFIAGRVVLGAVAPARDLGVLGSFFREMGLSAVVDAFAFAPEDKLVGDAAKQLAVALGVPNQNLSWLWSVDDFDTEFEKRGMRALEGAGIGAVLEPILRGVAWGIKVARGQPEAANKIAANAPAVEAPTQAADAPVPVSRVDLPEQLELPLTPPAKAADEVTPPSARVDTSITPPTQAAPQAPVVVSDKLPRELAGAKPRYRQSQIEFESDIDKALFITSQQRKSARDGDYRNWLKSLGYTDQEIASSGQQVRAALKEAGKGDPDVIQLSRTVERKVAEQVDQTPVQPPSTTATREETIEDVLTPKSPEEKVVTGLIDEPLPRPSNPIQQIIDQIPDLTFTRNETGSLVAGLTDTSFKAVVDAVNPFIEQAIKLADTNASDLVSFFNRANTVEEVEKFAALMNLAVKKVAEESALVSVRIEALQTLKRTADAVALEKTELTPLLNLKDKFDRVDSPMATMAAQIMVRRQIEQRLTAATRVRVNPLREAGITDRQIGAIIADAVDTSGNKMFKVDQLVAQRDIAFKAGDLKLVERLDKQIEKAVTEVEKGVKKELDSTFNIVVKTFNDITIPFILSGLPTLIVNVVAPAVTYGVRNAGDIVGMTMRKGPVFAYNQQRSKLMGLQAGIDGQRKMLANVIDAVLKERSKIFATDGYAIQEAGFIRAENYGLDGATKAGTAVNVAGKSVRALTWPLALTDEFYGQVMARAEIGAEAGFNFQTNVASKISDLQAQIKQANGVDKEALQKQLRELKANPTITVPVEQVETVVRDGVEATITKQIDTTMTLKEFIEHRVGKAFDDQGRLIDPRVSEEVAGIALRDALTSNVGSFVEDSFSKYPILRTLQPILRIPINSFIRGMETIPVFVPFIKDPQSIYADVKGFNGPRRQIEAQGRIVIGTAITALAWELGVAGLITGEEPQNKWQRNNAQAANDTRGYNVNIGGQWLGFNGVDPFSTAFKISANYHQMTRAYSMREDVMKKSGYEHFFIGVESFASSARDIPTFELLQTVSDFLQSTEKSRDDPNATKRALEKFFTKQASKTVPAMVRNVNQLIDPTRIDTAGGSLADQVMNTLKAEYGFRDQVPRMYDILGEPLKVPRSTRAIYGLFAPLDVDKVDAKEYVRQSINRIEVMTGRSFSMTPNPPGLKDIDLREYKSKIGNASIASTYFKAYGAIKDQDGMTVSDRLYTLLRGAEQTPLAVGNYKEDGPLTQSISETITKFKKLAWEYTRIVDPVTDLMTDINRIERNKLMSRDPRLDPVIPDAFPGFAN